MFCPELISKDKYSIKVQYKPMSVNVARKGKRYKSNQYKQYESFLLAVLPNYNIPLDGSLIAIYTFGLSSKLADRDNPIKPTQDILQKKYWFDDKRIKKAIVDIEMVDKWKEFIKFEIWLLKLYTVSITRWLA